MRDLTRLPWRPLSPPEVAALFSGSGVPWWVAGGYAIELAVGRPLRSHADIDVLLLRRDQLAVQHALPGWEWWAADPPGVLRPWRPGELLPVGVHDVWCRPAGSAHWRVQVMLDESTGDDWVSRRDGRLRRRIDTLTHVSSSGIPYLAPEIQLFYKSNSPRPRDQIDFDAAFPLLSAGQRQWLAEAITATHGSPAWLDRLSGNDVPRFPKG